MQARQALIWCSLAWAMGCEDGPDEVFTPLEGDPSPQNGFETDPDVFVPGDDKSFDDVAGGDDVGRSLFCNESEQTALTQEMVVKPIVPDVSAGGIPLWREDGAIVYADDLLGTRADGKFCNPNGTYADGFTWGPTQEVVLLFEQETHFVTDIVLTQQYLGAMEGTFSAEGVPSSVVVQPRERMKVDGEELDVYASRAQAPSEPRSWLNPANINKLYRMVRETFFGAEPAAADFDCVATQVCDVVYTSANEDTPQSTSVVLRDSGVILSFSPEGQTSQIRLQPVRSAPFENSGGIAFGADDATVMSFGFESLLRPDCALDLEAGINWSNFQRRCIASGDERAIQRATYDVFTARDAVSVGFTGVTLGFMRDTTSAPLFENGEQPAADDTLFAISFSRTLPAAVSEFRPLTLGTLYKERLEQRLRSAVAVPDDGGNQAPGLPGTPPAPDNPFSAFTLTVPALPDTPQRMAELVTPEGATWVPSIVSSVATLYADLTPEQKAVVDPRVQDPIFVIEPLVDAILSSFSHGEADAPGASKLFRTTADRRFSIGAVSFVREGVPYRLEAQYSLNYGALTSVTVARGESVLDRLINQARIEPATPFFEGAEMRAGTLFSLGSNAITVEGFDRQLQTLQVSIAQADGSVAALEVSGSPLADLTGYQRQIRGERFEFVPANQVNLVGKHTTLVLWVREDGTIGKVDNLAFKGALELCPGLPIRYGDNVQDALLAWQATVSATASQNCDVVFNYSTNGNVLGSIASIGTRTSFAVVDGRAINASVWQ